jgi:3-hydroxyisobutyrate dehydrogenase-like beta-hydroxyacid dehydrogenase
MTAVKEVFENKKLSACNCKSRKLIINMSTVAPETSRYLAEKCLPK